MSYNNLKKFVKQQAVLGTDPYKLKEGLRLNGWDSAEVDRAISEVYGLKRKVLKTGLFVIVSLIVVLSLSLLFIFSDLYNSNGFDPLTNSSLTVDSSCASIKDVSLKDACYLEKIENGFVCDDLIGDELFYCDRVFEYHILVNFEKY